MKKWTPNEEDKKEQIQSTGLVRKTLMNLLARREYSEMELQVKLRGRFPLIPEEVEEVLREAKMRGWIPKDAEAQRELAERVAEVWHRKLKGIHFINVYLEKKGLSPLPMDSNLELKKALQFLEKQVSKTRGGAREGTRLFGLLGRRLQARGFDPSTIRKALSRQVLVEIESG